MLHSYFKKASRAPHLHVWDYSKCFLFFWIEFSTEHLINKRSSTHISHYLLVKIVSLEQMFPSNVLYSYDSVIERIPCSGWYFAMSTGTKGSTDTLATISATGDMKGMNSTTTTPWRCCLSHTFVSYNTNIMYTVIDVPDYFVVWRPVVFFSCSSSWRAASDSSVLPL